MKEGLLPTDSSDVPLLVNGILAAKIPVRTPAVVFPPQLRDCKCPGEIGTTPVTTTCPVCVSETTSVLVFRN